ncbi:hypothetical protein ACWGEU_37620, partial [Streptomyces goshikiensis]
MEGTVNKIKMLKRQMFGRANFDLLRILVPPHPLIHGVSPVHTSVPEPELVSSDSHAVGGLKSNEKKA